MRNNNKSESESHASTIIGLNSDSSGLPCAASTMHAIFATLAIVILACKMAAAGDQVFCYECTAGSEDECIASESETITCSRVGYEYLQEGERKNGGHNKDKDKSDLEEFDFEKFKAKFDAEQKQNREKTGQIDQKMEKKKAQFYQQARERHEKIFQVTLKTLVVYRESVTGEKIPDDDALRTLKLIAMDGTIPKEAQNDRAIAWIEQLDTFVRTEENIDKASIEAFSKRFSKEWKAAYDEREKKEKENAFVDARSNRQDGKQQYLISSYDTADSWCATFKSKELGFHRGCGVVVEGYEFKQGCYPMSGPYQGVTYCRCDEDKCNDPAPNGKAANEGLKLNGKITFILMATVLVHFM